MKGTEKQIKWAEDIIADARDTIAQMINQNEERAAQYPSAAKIYTDRAGQWKRLSEQVEAAIARVEDASLIINKREMFSFKGLCKWADRA